MLMERSEVSLRKVPSVQWFVRQALPLEEQENIGKPTRDRGEAEGPLQPSNE